MDLSTRAKRSWFAKRNPVNPVETGCPVFDPAEATQPIVRREGDRPDLKHKVAILDGRVAVSVSAGRFAATMATCNLFSYKAL